MLLTGDLCNLCTWESGELKNIDFLLANYDHHTPKFEARREINNISVWFFDFGAMTNLLTYSSCPDDVPIGYIEFLEAICNYDQGLKKSF